MRESFSVSSSYVEISTMQMPMVSQVSKLGGGLFNTDSEICLFSHQHSTENMQCTYNFSSNMPFLSSLLSALS